MLGWLVLLSLENVTYVVLFDILSRVSNLARLHISKLHIYHDALTRHPTMSKRQPSTKRRPLSLEKVTTAKFGSRKGLPLRKRRS